MIPTMRIPSPVCQMCGTKEYIDVTQEQLLQLASPNRPHIQEVLPEVSPDIRELFVSGLCGKCWDKLFEGFDA